MYSEFWPNLTTDQKFYTQNQIGLKTRVDKEIIKWDKYFGGCLSSNLK